MVVGSFYFLWHTTTSAACRIIRLTGPGASLGIYFDPADSTIYPYINTAGNKSSALTVDTWYRIDFKADTATGTSKLDVQVDGTAITQKTFDQTSAAITGIYIGLTNSVSGELFYDDVIISYMRISLSVALAERTRLANSALRREIVTLVAATANDTTGPLAVFLAGVPEKYEDVVEAIIVWTRESVSPTRVPDEASLPAPCPGTLSFVYRAGRVERRP